VAKTSEDLSASREGYATLLSKFGKLPQSIMVHDKRDTAIDLMAEERSYVSTQGRYKSADPNLKTDAFDVSDQGCHQGALSRFPQNVGRSLLLLYTEDGDTVVDPFAGHNSRMELCWRSGRHYIGCDLSAKFMQANRTIRQMLLDERDLDLFGVEHFKADITLHEGDSRSMPIEDGAGDFTITSPPYWDIEDYGPEPQQLGKNTYDGFLEGLYQVMRENFRCLKPGAFCVWCINDFRRDGKFYSYHEDTARGLRAAGFEQWDIAITDLGGSMRACFPNQVLQHKILPKRHEYCLIFKKP
jgi:DNA methylase